MKTFILFCLGVLAVQAQNDTNHHVPLTDAEIALFDNIFDINYNQNDTSLPPELEANVIPVSQHVSNTHVAFDWKLLKAVIAHSNASNVLISPFGIKLMLTVLYEASDDGTPTQRQLEKVNPSNNLWILHGQELRQPYEKEIASIRQNAFSYNVDFGTRVFVDQIVEPKERLTVITEKYYATEFERVDFNDTTSVAQTMNDWVARATRDNVQIIVDEESLTASTVVLLNAASFQALWSISFSDEEITGSFYSPPNRLVNATYMRTAGRFYFYDSEKVGAKIIRLPYAGKKFAMFVVLPHNKKLGLTQLIADLDGIDFHELLYNMDACDVNVLLPKFKIDFKTNINDVVRSFQIERIFTKDVSLSAFAVPSDTEGFEEGAPVSGIYHAASIAVTEKSVKEEAAPAANFGFGDIKDDQRSFEAAWPFLFYIQDETTGTILFAGTVTEPEL